MLHIEDDSAKKSPVGLEHGSPETESGASVVFILETAVRMEYCGVKTTDIGFTKHPNVSKIE